MIKNKKQSLIVVGAFILVLVLFTTTYAFFNYTRTGAANTIRVGRISFVSKNEQTISLTNLFPIDPTETGIMNDNTKVGTYSIDIEGDTDYVDGIEYLVSITNANIYTSTGKTVPISIDVTVDSLGTPNANYFTARESKDTLMYKKIVGDTIVGDGMLLVGYISQNDPTGTADGVDGNITIKAYLDENKILISDTYDGTESYNMGTPNSLAQGKTVITTSEWNALQSSGVSFKVKVEANEGIWVNGSLEEIMRKSAVMDNINSDYVNNETPGINFGEFSSDTNGKGVYMRAGTEDDDYPIMYYRGAIEDNNVAFANKCWKAVRTTDTGGVKLIYNGKVSAEKAPLSQSDYGTPVTNNGFTFDTLDNSWNATMTTNITNSDAYEISFNVSAGDGYVLLISGVSTTVGGVIGGVYKGNTQVNGFGGGGGDSFQLTHTFGELTSNSTDVVKVTYYMTNGNSTSENPSTIKVQMLKPDITLGIRCDNSGTDSQITLNNTYAFAFNTSSDSPAYNGYMYGEVYTYNSGAETSGAYFGNSFTWDGTNYKLVDAVVGKNNTHHYTCNLTTVDGTCEILRYYYFQDYYVNLTGGDGIEQAIEKMQTNTNDSNAKDKIDTWYASNLTSYTSKLEDTIWCNDRSFGNGNNNGWIANGGNLYLDLYYGAYQRSAFASSASTVKNQPSLACANKNDSFTVNSTNGNKNLTYPIALLTNDEMVLAGGIEDDFDLNETLYLNNGYHYWSMSPSGFRTSATGLRMGNGRMGAAMVYSAGGLRPAISIKPGQLIIKGTGTVADPYVIE